MRRLGLQKLPDLQLLPDIGGGPRLHSHPYAEIFIIRQGTGLFTVGDRQIEASAGQIVIVPPDTPHKFTNLGPGPLETTDIHENGSFITKWLESPAKELLRAQPDEHGPGDIVLTDHRVVLAQAAEFALDEVAVHGFGRFLEEPGPLLLVVSILTQLGQRLLDALPGASERCRLFGQDFMAERVEGGFRGRSCRQTVGATTSQSPFLPTADFPSTSCDG